MRILHTSDWHVGVLLGGKDRIQEHAVFFEELFEIVQDEKTDVVLVSGDLFDGPNPTAEAEKLVFDFFRKIAEKKISLVFISGNHDSGPRIEGKARLLELVNIHAFGIPRFDAAVEIATQYESLVVAALPFAGELRLLDWGETGQLYDGDQKFIFAERMKALLLKLAEVHFKPNAVNVLMGHLTMDGALLSGSEKSIRMSDTWALPPSMLPSYGHYMALGHIHKAQLVPHAPIPCAYSGSPLYIDFGEEKDEKGVYILEGSPNKPMVPIFRPLQRITPVKTFRTSLKELSQAARLLKNFQGHLKTVVSLDEEDKKAGIAQAVRHQLPQTIIVNVETTQDADARVLPDVKAALENPLEAYKLYLHSQNRELTPDLAETFHTLYGEVIRASS